MVKAGISKGLIDETKVVIGGWSQGGFLSYLAVTRSDFSFRAAICGAGVVDWDMMSMTSDGYTFESELAGKAPWEEGSDSTQDRRGSPLWHMKNVKTPILILHGENDVRVPVSQAVAFHRGCLHHKIPCEMVIYPREPHFMQERLHRLDMLKRIRRFCDLHLR
jgi:dipeptidyl aminopeptidase/acylaminoacyl peptidase